MLPSPMVRMDALPPDHPVQFPQEVLQASLQQGKSTVRLSAIYAACPFMFTRQVLPQEDVDITLPAARFRSLAMGEIPAMSPFSRTATGATGGQPTATSHQIPEPVLPAFPRPPGQGLPFATNAAGGLPPSPFAKTNGVPTSGSPFSAAQPSAVGQPTLPPMAAHMGQRSGAVPAPFTPPLSMATGVRSVTSPFAVAAPQQNPATPASPPLVAPVLAPPSESPRPITLPVATVNAAPTTHHASMEDVIQVPLRAVLAGLSIEELGFNAEAVPAPVPVSLKIARILPQLASGRVVLSVAELCGGLAEKFLPAFAQTKSNLQINVPLAEIFKVLPPHLIPAPTNAAPEMPALTSPFPTPFTAKAQEDQSIPLPPLLQQQARMQAQARTNGVPTTSPFAAAPGAPFAAAPAPASPDLGGNGAGISLPPLPHSPNVQLPPAFQMAPAPTHQTASQPVLPPPPAAPEMLDPNSPFHGQPRTSPFSRPPGGAEQDDLGHAMPADSLRAAPPSMVGHATQPHMLPPQPQAPPPAAPPPAAPQQPQQQIQMPPPQMQPQLMQMQPQPVPQQHYQPPPPEPLPPPPVVPAPQQIMMPSPQQQQPQTLAAPPADLSFGIVEDMTQLALRALFMTERSLTPQEIIEQCAQFPGLGGAVFLDGRSAVGASRIPSNPEIAALVASAPETYNSLTHLASAMGVAHTGSFTMRTDRALRSFFIERGVCLAVLHDQPNFQPGVREKLILVSRALSAMQGYR